MSIVFKAGAGLMAGFVAGGLGLALLPRLDKHAIQPRSAVEKPQFVVASAPAASTPQPAATLAIATETPAAKPTPVASATPEKLALRPTTAPPVTVAPANAEAPAPAPPKPAVVAAVETPAPAAATPVAVEPAAIAPAKAAPEDAARWSVRGLVALAKGDLSTARLFLNRAAEAGDARAWVALADTYDPAMLAKLGVVFAPGDAQRARDCLVKAMAAGVVVSKDRLATLDSGAQPVR